MSSHAMFEGLESRQLLAVFTVTNTRDAGAGSLRQAVLDANAAAGADVIEFSSGLAGTIALSSGELNVSDSLSINGPGANALAVNAGSASRVFNFTSGTSFLRRLSITRGSATAGAGVANAGTLTIEACDISSNSAVAGGAIANTGTLTALGSTFAYNSASGSGAGLYNDAGGVMSLLNCTISLNSTSGQYGGGIDTLGTLTVSNSTIAYNFASAGRAISIRGAGNATAISTIIASSQSNVVYGVFEAGSINNLLQYSGGGLTNGVNGNIVGVDPFMSSLSWAGGPTKVHALRDGSPAINKGVNPNSLTTDQRGGIYARQVGAVVDIGAFEFGGDDYANSGDWAGAHAITLNAADHGIGAGVLEQNFDTDLFIIVPAASGLITITLDVPSGFDGWLEVYNSSHTRLVRASDWSSGRDEIASFTAAAGQTYFIVVGGFRQPDGAYSVLVADDHADAGEWTYASVITLNSTGDGTRSGVIDVADDTDLFKFTPVFSGTNTILLDVDSGLDGWIELYDSGRNLLASGNAGATNGDETLAWSLTAGQAYFVLVGGWRNPSGSYSVQIDDDHADYGAWSRATVISLTAELGGVRTGVVERPADTDLFTFTGSISKTITITLDVAAGFDGWFELYDANHNYLIKQNLRAAGGDESRTLAVSAGQMFYILVSGWRVPNGAYTVRIDDDHTDAGNWGSASDIPLNYKGDGSNSGTIDLPSDTDLFKFTQDISATTTIWLDVAGDFDGWFELYAPDHSLIVRQNGGATNGDEFLARALTAGQTYYILVGGWRNPGGGYSITIDDDHADQVRWSRASAITLNSAIDGGRAGVIERPGDLDLFKFSKADSGKVTITLDVGAGFDGWFRVFNSTGGELGSTRDSYAAGGDERDGFFVTGGQTYYILVGGSRVPSGDYTIRISDDHADAGDWSNASAMSINASLDALGEGRIEAAGDTDLFTFISPASGPLTITLDAASGFDGWFEVYSADHTLLRRQNLWAAGGDETYQLPVTNTQTFFILVGGWRVPTGDYRLLISDDHADAGIWPLATDIALSSTVDGSKTGVIEFAGDTDLFRFTAVATASTTFTLDAGEGFDGWFEVYDASQMLLLRKNLWGSGTDESGSVALTAGLVYYVLVGGWRVPGGHYTLVISDDHADALAWSGATALTPNEDGHAGAPGLIESADDTDLFLYTPAATGAVTITLDAVRGFDGWFEIYNADYTLIRRVNTTGAGGDEVWGFHLTQGQSYFVLVGGTLAPNGRYTLNLND
ncbi:MAG: right-handed parallel beta-helix repeat-containing protein [Phycisphaerales bacterium]|jgi:hypothetical protein|nr:right-handed parallel beta-helix repeat-containing protein [Phycisphaerales bacterium]